MCTHPFAKKALTLHLARSEGHECYLGCNLLHRKVLALSHQHLMAEAPPLEELEPTPALVGNGARRHRTALEEGGGLPPSSQASRSSQAGTEDRGEDINRIEEEGRLNVSRGEFQLRMGLTPLRNGLWLLFVGILIFVAEKPPGS